MPPKLYETGAYPVSDPIDAVQFTGGPKWYGEYLYGILKQARQLAKEPHQKYGEFTPEQKQRIAELGNLKSFKNAKIPVTIPGLSKPVMFTANELKEAQTNEEFARRVIYQATGKNDLKSAKNFQKNILVEHPNLNALVQASHQKTYRDEMNARKKRQLDLENALATSQQQAANLPNVKKNTLPADKEGYYKALFNTRNDWKDEKGNNLDTYEKFKPVMEYTINVDQPNSQWAKELPIWIKQQEDKNAQIEDENRIVDNNIALKAAEIERYKQKLASKAAKSDLFKLLEAQKEIEGINRRGQRIAPMNELHTEAQNMLEKGFNDNTLNLAKMEIEAAKKENSRNKIQPLLDKALADPMAYRDRYVSKYRKNVIQALKDETKEEFLDEVAPQINMNFAQHGAFHGGARNTALIKAREKQKQHLDREIAKLLHHAEEKGMEHAHVNAEKHLKGADLTHQATKANQEMLAKNAELLRLNAQSKNVMRHTDVNALAQMAKAKQEQEQNELNIRLQEHKAQEEYPYQQLQKESMIARGHPINQTQTYSAQNLGQPNPPNFYNAVGGILGNLYGQQQQGHQFAKGGRVRPKYAGGGAINRWQELGKHVPQNDPDIHASRSHAQNIGNYRVNPIKNWASHVGNQMLANITGDPLHNIGVGGMAASEAMERHHDRMLSSQEKAANLRRAIAESKLEYHKVLAAYENQREEMAEQQRHHGAIEAAKLAKYAQPVNNMNPESGMPWRSPEEEKQYFKLQAELEKAENEKANASENMGNTLDIMNKAVKEGIGPTGPVVGMLPDKLVTLNNEKQLVNRKIFSKENIRNIFGELAKQKGVQSDKDMAKIAETMPSTSDDLPVIKQWLENANKIQARAKESEKFIRAKKMEGYTVGQAKNMWKTYAEEHPLFADEVDHEVSNEPDPGAIAELKRRGLID